MRPLEAGQGQQLVMVVERLGGDPEVRAAIEDPAGNLLRTALLDMQAYRRILPDETLYDRR
jgi:hypothetical protein